MHTLKTIILTLVVLAVLVPLAGLGLIYSGAYNVAATSKHWPVTHWLLSQTVHRSITVHADGIQVPALGGREQLLQGAANYEAMCTGCHAAPGMEQDLPGAAMVPRPPRLDQAAKEMTPAQLFWVIKHGIKASGMPAWGSSHSQEEIWSMVALIQILPDMNAIKYQQLQHAADARGIGHHHEHGAHAHAHVEAGEARKLSAQSETSRHADGPAQ